MSLRNKDIKSGDKVGKLTITNVSKRENGHTYYLCECECGSVKYIRKDHLKNRKILSCGCWRKYKSSITVKTFKHGKSKTRLYGVLRDMKTRCYNPKSPDYTRYGARGIKICDEWLYDFEMFEKWAKENGYDENAPKGNCTIDRIDNDKGYCPENCRFITIAEQNKNKTYIKTKYTKDWIEKIKPLANLKRGEIAAKLNTKDYIIKYVLRYYHTSLTKLKNEIHGVDIDE